MHGVLDGMPAVVLAKLIRLKAVSDTACATPLWPLASGSRTAPAASKWKLFKEERRIDVVWYYRGSPFGVLRIANKINKQPQGPDLPPGLSFSDLLGQPSDF
jgi:hypothetical protein